jgi:predicted DNA-binding transcriptional regulator AlpA
MDSLELLNTERTAKLLSVTHQTLVNWRKANIGPPYLKLGVKTVRYRRVDVADWLDSQRQGVA